MSENKKLQLPEGIYKIEKSIFIAAPREKVFEAITDSEHWNKYFTTGMELDPRPGGVCNFKWKNWGPDLDNHESPGHVLEIDPPRRFAFEWGRPGEKTTAQLDLKTKHDGTVLSLFEDGYLETAEGLKSILECSAHWGELLALIKFYVEDGITYRSPEVGVAN
ncbi:MAG: SRPBCC domain-containing protein [candidate division Zixibacteria bacterium]|nr:SRPBCC domain-containing protein [candidate division Zixibacteria bacterium]MDH3935937.1 SRPBCC domain-containing protein [candidate division Zixibacteria bacterium]MDH4034853.1 SRPBCC domain-containing protein [candidate division Zixibacteria bacterium]